MVSTLEYFPYEGRLKKHQLFSLEKIRHEDLITPPKYLQGDHEHAFGGKFSD